ncbi:MAG: hypothetical protein IJ587_00320 [Synergistaceae bacterium]|nr:hypothetical protein [Synergistaceae bacterium]
MDKQVGSNENNREDEKRIKHYSIPDIVASYGISTPTLKNKIRNGEIQAKRQPTSYTNETRFKWLIPETELVKLEYCKRREPVSGEQSDPEYYEKMFRREEERRRQRGE